MNRILLSVLASAALSFTTTPAAFGDLAPHEAHHGHSHSHEHGSPNHHHAHHHHKVDASKTAEEVAKECEERLGKVKDAGATLPADHKKAEFDYNLKIANVEIETLRDVNLKDFKKHAHACHHHLKKAEQIVRQHENHMAHEKKMEERKAKAEERKANAAARKAKREADKAERAAAKAAAATHHGKHHEQEAGLDHGQSEGASKEAPGSEAAKPMQ